MSCTHTSDGLQFSLSQHLNLHKYILFSKYLGQHLHTDQPVAGTTAVTVVVLQLCA